MKETTCVRRISHSPSTVSGTLHRSPTETARRRLLRHTDQRIRAYIRHPVPATTTTRETTRSSIAGRSAEGPHQDVDERLGVLAVGIVVRVENGELHPQAFLIG